MSLQAQAKPAAKKVYDVIVIKDRCKECGLCISLCPPKVLDTEKTYNKFGYRPTYLKGKDGCIGCKICEFACPEFAIFVREASSNG